MQQNSQLLHFFLVLATFQTQQVALSQDNNNCDNVALNDQDIFTFLQQGNPIREWVRPVKDFKTPVAVDVQLVLRNIVEVTEKNEEIFIRGYFFFEWLDELRKWDKIWPLNCIDYILLEPGPVSGIWTPNVALTTS